MLLLCVGGVNILSNMPEGKLILKNGDEFFGRSFGAQRSIAGEVVFATGMTGYPEAITDPSFRGQILVLTYPIIGNYGIPDEKSWELPKIQISGLIVSNYIDTPSHYASKMTLAAWLKKENIPALEIKDTRAITIKLRDRGVMLGKISITPALIGSTELTVEVLPLNKGEERGGKKHFSKIQFEDPNLRNLVSEVSTKEIKELKSRASIGGSVLTKNGTIILIDCGAKRNIEREILKRGFGTIIVPWNTDVTKLKEKFLGVVISNGPGDPMMAKETVENVKKIMHKKIPILGICLGNQILALAAGGKTYKLKFGHRGQNQPCVLSGTKKCYLTTQNHGFAVKKIPSGFKEWFYNANDNTNEGIIHKSMPWMSVQFHPEATPGPMDTEWIFDYFISRLNYLRPSSSFQKEIHLTPQLPLQRRGGSPPSFGRGI